MFFGGDVSYYQDQILEDKYAAANVSKVAAENSYKAILDLSKETRLIYLPSHEWACIDRLKNMEILQK